ncbi:phosphatidylinositol 4-kinase [Tremella mesenterica]|uniref:1-phosphatidylinositol 4-kinase n=1 Tax=Tremella mesenterica TaxID=5217 RepID=A0A4Q1BDA2_TREME|nr:phosphatidylinositol 4-kinase [Tremella mesenterica]
MDSLDEPLHLHILTSLASNLAKYPTSTSDNSQESISILLKGLPQSPTIQQVEEEWSEFEINRSISYAHYVSSLPLDSPYLSSSLPKLRTLLDGLLAHKKTCKTDSPSSSAGRTIVTSLGTSAQAQLCESLLGAVFWVGWGVDYLRQDVIQILVDLLDTIGEMMKADGPHTFPLVLLTSIHSVLSRCPLPGIPTQLLPTLMDKTLLIAGPANLVKLLRYGSNPNTPAEYRLSPFTPPHPQTPGAVVLLISEIMGIFLATALLPLTTPHQHDFARQIEIQNLAHSAGKSPVLSQQIESLIREEINQDAYRLSASEYGEETLGNAKAMAMRWWSELMGVGEGTGITRRNSVFNMGGVEHDEEIDLRVSVLHLLNFFNLHEKQKDEAQLARLKLLLSENSTVGDSKILEAAFICTSILVRNEPSLGAGMAHHIRRLLTSPLPAFEGEMAAFKTEVPPAVMAASQCLAICIQSAPNDDLISSTLYSLLNLLTHGGGSSIAPGQLLGSSIPHRTSPSSRTDTTDRATVKSDASVKRTEEQRRLVAVTAVQVVSRLALDIGRDDIIHLSISMLLQRLRGVDFIIEATIAISLVPLALASNNSDLVDVYRAFSQISRSAHPEDPRMASNAVLAAQTTLAKGMSERLDCADGYLVELLTLFADKGTQTQMIAMAPYGFDTRDKEKLAHLKEDSEARVSDMKSWLAALLIPISSLLSHSNYNPSKSPSPELVSHFRNLWFLCVAFNISSWKHKKLSDHEQNALNIIAEKSPALLLESMTDYVASELEYNSVIRKDFAQSIQQYQRSILPDYLPQRHSHHIRSMSVPQMTFLMAIYDLENLRTLRYRPSVLLQYFSNESVNNSLLHSPLEALGNKIISNFLKQLSKQVVLHSLPHIVSDEVCEILKACTHRFRKVREMALKYARGVLETFSALMCDKKVVWTLLEILTLMRRSCELQYTDEYSPVYEFHSDKLDLTLQLTEDYSVRNEIVTQLHTVAKSWLTLAISRAPIEVQSTLQSYLSESRDVLLIDSVEMGAGLALHFSKVISKLDRQEMLMPNIGGWPSDCSNLVASQYAAKNYYVGELSGVRHVVEQGLKNLQKDAPLHSSEEELLAFKSQMAQAVTNIRNKQKPFSVPEVRRILLRAASVLTASPKIDSDIIHYLVELPMTAFTPLAIAAGVDAWTWLLRQRPEAEVAVIGEIAAGWIETVRAGKGMFSTSMNYTDPFEKQIQYAPSEKKVLDLELAKARKLLRPHLLLIQVLSSQFQAIKYRQPGIMVSLIRLMMRSLGAHKKMSTHPIAREVRFSLLLFGFQMLASSKMEALLELRFRDRLFTAAFSWFSVRPQWSFGSDRIQVGAEIKLLQDFLVAAQEDQIRGDHSTSSFNDRNPALLVRGFTSLSDYASHHKDRVQLLKVLIESEISRLNVWSNPSNEPGRSSGGGVVERSLTAVKWNKLVNKAWRMSPAMAVHMGERFKHLTVQNELVRLVRSNPKSVMNVPEALHYLLGDRLDSGVQAALQWLPLWAEVPPVTALMYFQPRFGNHPLILQYAMRVLEQHEVDLTFFFVPQVVQALRSDALGYVERFIFETSQISQLFCHQIIWNMKANTYKDDNASEEDSMKPLLDRMINMIVAGLNGKARDFYDTEFSFFNEITSISGKLRPYIKKSKPEKKAKIDEEMEKIELKIGVYLPSNPDGNVVDLDRKSGRPLQSHAKAPFMATFKVRRTRIDLPTDSNIEISDEAEMVTSTLDVWQSAIFKVGDDCRQDVLALQVIAMFKNVFDSVGLSLYLFPYRVTATAPGCGVIDVVPNATSRDEMGRAKINDLFSYFVDKYGGIDTLTFQKARLNFIQSMAAYSIACFILQIKDRHNGNIMIDSKGHIVHVDFGFLFDIGPGGIKFEPSSFKLNHEMVYLMGGKDSQGYKMFVELTVKAFLSIRPHAGQLCDTVGLMLGTGLPSFKGEGTIKRLKERFQLHLTERGAADFMLGIIRNAHENMRSNVYDGFQKLQNGIPY